MFNAAYKTDFYRAVRDALHAEVDSWHANAGVETTHLTLRLVAQVDELELVSRDADALCAFSKNAAFTSTAFVPVEELASASGS